jgi:replicative DNA helicase
MSHAHHSDDIGRDIDQSFDIGDACEGEDVPRLLSAKDAARRLDELDGDRLYASLEAMEHGGALPADDPARVELQSDTLSQVADALDYMTQDFSKCPRLEWDSLHDVIGHILPYWFWVIAAATGNGKSTTLMSIVKHFARERWPVYMLPLEQPTDVMRLYWAALELGYHPTTVLENRYRELPADARAQIAAHLKWQATDGERLVHFDRATGVNERVLEQAVKRAVAFGAKIVIVDHIHRLELEGNNPHASLKRMCKHIKELAKGYRIPILCAAQLHRDKDGDVLAPFKPPKPTAIEGGEVIRQECDVAFGLYRPLVDTFDEKDAVNVRMGRAQIKPFLEPNAVGVHMLKHRLRGDQFGTIVRLRYERGAIVCPETERRLAYESRHGL